MTIKAEPQVCDGQTLKLLISAGLEMAGATSRPCESTQCVPCAGW